ncbi:hypothetical protein AAGR22_01750 [Erwinia sp. HDF1-3R]|uniref:hypothetical protein n=1 Tax=Erwinia sp. HDF1-3R TaxID=3141543 RepID=UPI0031F55443
MIFYAQADVLSKVVSDNNSWALKFACHKKKENESLTNVEQLHDLVYLPSVRIRVNPIKYANEAMGRWYETHFTETKGYHTGQITPSLQHDGLRSCANGRDIGSDSLQLA